MLEKELKRVLIICLIGMGIALVSISSRNSGEYGLLLVIPVYFLGIVYAGRKLLQAIGSIMKIFCSCEFISLLVNPLWGTILSVLLFCIGLLGILCLGWLFGLYKCGYGIWEAYRTDLRQIPH